MAIHFSSIWSSVTSTSASFNPPNSARLVRPNFVLSATTITSSAAHHRPFGLDQQQIAVVKSPLVDARHAQYGSLHIQLANIWLA
jgi:hypothetical protein